MPSDALPFVALPILGALGLLLIAWAAAFVEARLLRKRARSTRVRGRTHSAPALLRFQGTPHSEEMNDDGFVDA